MTVICEVLPVGITGFPEITVPPVPAAIVIAKTGPLATRNEKEVPTEAPDKFVSKFAAVGKVSVLGASVLLPGPVRKMAVLMISAGVRVMLKPEMVKGFINDTRFDVSKFSIKALVALMDPTFALWAKILLALRFEVAKVSRTTKF